MYVSQNIDNDMIKNIENEFGVIFITKSKIDGCPIFTTSRDNLYFNSFRDCFELQLISTMEDNIGHYITGYTYTSPKSEMLQFSEIITIKIIGIKKDYYQYMRGVKLKKLDIFIYNNQC
jgi:hypothetical protein